MSFSYTIQPHTALHIAAKINSSIERCINTLTVEKELLSMKGELGSVTMASGQCTCQIIKQNSHLHLESLAEEQRLMRVKKTVVSVMPTCQSCFGKNLNATKLEEQKSIFCVVASWRLHAVAILPQRNTLHHSQNKILKQNSLGRHCDQLWIKFVALPIMFWCWFSIWGTPMDANEEWYAIHCDPRIG